MFLIRHNLSFPHIVINQKQKYCILIYSNEKFPIFPSPLYKNLDLNSEMTFEVMKENKYNSFGVIISEIIL